MCDIWGWLCEYMAHECVKCSLAFRKPAVAAASRRPARADGPKVGDIDGRALQASAPGEAAPRGALMRAVQHQLSADDKQKVSAMSAEAIGS